MRRSLSIATSTLRLCARALASLLFVSALTVTTLAQGQERTVVVVPLELGSGATANPPARLEALASALGSSGYVVTSPAEAAELIEDRNSREEVLVGADEVGALVDAVHALEEMVALRQRDAAVEQARRVEELSHGTTDVLATQRELAETIFAGCAADAWLHIQLGEQAAARSRLRACRQLYPDVVVVRQMTAPPVYALVTEIDAELAARPTHALRIAGAPGGCAIEVNRRVLATTPEAVSGLPAGEYEVELRCPGTAHARVHSLTMPAEDRTITIDPAFDDALRTVGGTLALRLAAAEGDTRAVEYALRIASAVQVSHALLVIPNGTGARLVLASVGRSETRRADLGPTADVSATVARLLAGPATAHEEEVQGPEEGGAQGGPLDPGAGYAGIVVGSLGAAALIAGLGTSVGWDTDLHTYSPMDPTLLLAIAYRARALDEQWASIALGAAGGALLSASVPLWLPPERDVPWWSWTLGAIGLAGLASSAAAFTTSFATLPYNSSECHCLDVNYYTPYGAVVLGASAALVAIPLTHLLRLAVGPLAPSAAVDIDGEHASLAVRGTW